VFRGTPADCASCHDDAHAGQLGSRCETCHSSDTFKLARYVHGGQGLDRFFVGTHATLACRACHKPEERDYPRGRLTAVRYKGFGTACAACHAGEDVHRGALGPSCETCHQPEGWPTVSRAFHKGGIFPLDGRHLAVPCASCHIEGVTKGTPNRCVDCHWVRRQDDPYQTRLGTQCEQCHRTTSWAAVNWNHGARTGYALNLAHQVLRCDNCHRKGQFINTRMDCFSCHQAAYQATRAPNHAEAGFSTACETCHRPIDASWRNGGLNHASYPLVGVHATQACGACHVNKVYLGTPRDCVGCHRDDYQRTQNPNHAAAGFPTTCESCHRATEPSFAGTAFNHAAVFPLAGVHATQACATCHRNNVYAGTPRTCVGCHQGAYDQTRSPSHRASGFGTDCESCHRSSDASWRDGRFNHRFPITSGRHSGHPCTVCHVDGGNYRVFSCTTGCHGRGETDREHSGRNGYRYDSQACYACHPTGRGD